MNRRLSQYRMKRLALVPLLLVCSTSLLHANALKEFDSSSDACTQELMNLANQVQTLNPNDESDAATAQAQNLIDELQAKAQQCLTPTATNDAGKNTDQEQQQQNEKDATPTLSEVANETADYINIGKRTWEGLKGESITEPFKLLFSALSAADTASTGEVPANSKAIGALKDYVSKQGDALDTLAHKSANDWLVESGINAFDPATAPKAQQYLDNVGSSFANIQQVTEAMLPKLNAAKVFLEDETVQGLRATAAQTTLTGLDPIALGDAISRLGGCVTDLKTIQQNIYLARSAIQ